MSATAMPGDRQKRGFALMDKKLLREIAARAGKASQATGTANRFTKTSGKVAGKKGGLHSGVVRSRRKKEREGGAAPPAMLVTGGAAGLANPTATVAHGSGKGS